MGKRLICFCHSMRVFSFLYRSTTIFGCIHEFLRKAQSHRFLIPPARGVYKPAHGQCSSSRRTHFNGNLIGGTTNTTGLDLDHRPYVVKCPIEYLERIFLCPLCNSIKGTVDHPFRDGFLSIEHEYVHEFSERPISELGVRQNCTLSNLSTARHSRYLSSWDAWPRTWSVLGGGLRLPTYPSFHVRHGTGRRVNPSHVPLESE